MFVTIDNKDKFVLKFGMGTIEHLGIQMYKTLPPVLAELISNSYDADAENVEIHFEQISDGTKRITIRDDGLGMSFTEVNSRFLVVGQNRRLSNENGSISLGKRRKVTGRKGIGKLAVFGIAEEIRIMTIKDGFKNEFILSLPQIKECEKGTENNLVPVYEPEVIHLNSATSSASGTTITLSGIKRKSPFNIDETVEAVAKRFTFNDDDFVVKFVDFGNVKKIIDKNTRWDIFKTQFEWTFPENEFKSSSQIDASSITGKIITTEKPLQEADRGIALFARGKLVNNNEFYGIKATISTAYNYMTGFLNVDFVDDGDKDLINTSRDGLLWDNDDSLLELKRWIQAQIKGIEKLWREKRKEQRKANYKKKSNGKDVYEWTRKLPKHEKKIAVSIIDIVTNADGISDDIANSLYEYVEGSFQYTAFQEFASDLENVAIDSPEWGIKLLKLFQEWEIIEAKEFYRLCIGRVKTIETLERLIDENAREVPDIHNFLKEHPWLMEPRIRNFEDEITYTKLLREKFPEKNNIPKEDRRLDFFCKSFNNDIYIYELKRPKTTAKAQELTQLTQYKEFVSNHCGNEARSFSNIFCYLICKGISVQSGGAHTLASALATQNIYVRTYLDILSQARNYHREFLEKYNKLMQSACCSKE